MRGVWLMAALFALGLAGCTDNGQGRPDGAVFWFIEGRVDDEPCGTGQGARTTEGCHVLRFGFHNEGLVPASPTDFEVEVFATSGRLDGGYGTHSFDAQPGASISFHMTVEVQRGERVETVEWTLPGAVERVRVPPY